MTAAQLGMGLRTYYDHIRRFSVAASSLAESINRVQEQLTPDGAPQPPQPAAAPTRHIARRQ